jgi:hypothetical protein
MELLIAFLLFAAGTAFGYLAPKLDDDKNAEIAALTARAESAEAMLSEMVGRVKNLTDRGM